MLQQADGKRAIERLILLLEILLIKGRSQQEVSSVSG